MKITFNNMLTGEESEFKQTEKEDGSILLSEDEDRLKKMTREELITECERREKVCHKIWAAIVSEYGPDGFTKILNRLETK